MISGFWTYLVGKITSAGVQGDAVPAAKGVESVYSRDPELIS